MNCDQVMDLIRYEKEKQGVTITELANRTGSSKSNVKYWLDGGGITLENADKVLRALGVNVRIGSD